VQELLAVDSMPLWRPLLWSGKVALRLIVVDDLIMWYRLCERTSNPKSGAQPSQDYSAKAIHGFLFLSRRTVPGGATYFAERKTSFAPQSFDGQFRQLCLTRHQGQVS
jgi:hypothetical protein